MGRNIFLLTIWSFKSVILDNIKTIWRILTECRFNRNSVALDKQLVRTKWWKYVCFKSNKDFAEGEGAWTKITFFCQKNVVFEQGAEQTRAT